MPANVHGESYAQLFTTAVICHKFNVVNNMNDPLRVRDMSTIAPRFNKVSAATARVKRRKNLNR